MQWQRTGGTAGWPVLQAVAPSRSNAATMPKVHSRLTATASYPEQNVLPINWGCAASGDDRTVAARYATCPPHFCLLTRSFGPRRVSQGCFSHANTRTPCAGLRPRNGAPAFRAKLGRWQQGSPAPLRSCSHTEHRTDMLPAATARVFAAASSAAGAD